MGISSSMKIGIVFGGPSPEHDISVLTGLQVSRILSDSGLDVTRILWANSNRWLKVPAESEAVDFLAPEIKGSSGVELSISRGFLERRKVGSPKTLSFDVILNCCHGGPGEDGGLTSMLGLAGYSVSGPTPEAAHLSMDKFATAAIANAIGVPTIPTQLLEDGITIKPPWVVKPRFGGSSLGVEVNVMDLEVARSLSIHGVSRSGVVVQPYLKGWDDLNVAVRVYPELATSLIERPLRGKSEILDYRTKYLSGADGMESTPRELPADIPVLVAQRISDYSRRLIKAMGLTGLPRVDFLWDGKDEVLLCEVNSIPGALGLYLWEASGQSRLDVLIKLIEETSRSSPHRPHWIGSTDGRALRIADSIATKLMR